MSLASSSYYYQPLTDLQAQEHSDAELCGHIERLQQDFPGYGYRRLGQQLRREGIVVNDKRIRRVQSKYVSAKTKSDRGDKVLVVPRAAKSCRKEARRMTTRATVAINIRLRTKEKPRLRGTGCITLFMPVLKTRAKIST